MKFQQKFKILFTRSELNKLILLFFAILIMAILEVVGVASIVPFMSVIASPEIIHNNTYLSNLYNFLQVDSENEFIIFLGIAIIVLLFLSNITQAFITWKMTFFAQNQYHRLQVRMLEQYLAEPYSFYLNKNSSELSKNILTEVSAVINGVVLQSLLGLSKIFIVIFIFVLLLLVNPIVAITTTVILFGSYLIIYSLVRTKLRTIGIKKTTAVFHTFKSANESMAGIKEIKIRNSEKEFVNRFIPPSKELAEYAAQVSVIAALPRYLLEVVAFGGIIAISTMLIATKPGSSNEVIPIISLYAMAGYRLMPALQQIYGAISNVKYNIPAFNILVNDFNNLTEKNFNKIKDQKPCEFNHKLQIRDINFFYKGEKNPVINNLNLDVKKNTTVGLIGPSGVGKTTLIDIILGLLTPDSGNIIVDGIKINKENIAAWQKNIGYVPQSIYLTDDSIEKNIAFSIAENEIDRAKLVSAAKMANVDTFINSLPDQYKTLVGERGVRLSGGQRQRIGIARALYHNPTILVFDEATSSLDGITEDVIMDSIHNLSHKKTIIMIAHRMTTVKECDVIHMMKDGKIFDSGTYDELFQKNKDFQLMAKND
jgi:ATP-binding cassette, subfamily B, bacterial PglK